MTLDLFAPADLEAMDRRTHPVAHPFTAHITHYGVVLPAAERDALFNALLHEAPWKKRFLQLHGKEVETPRDIAWYGATRGQGVYAHDAQAWPEALLGAKALVERLTGHVYNGCLCNLYRDGTHSVAWHSDREALTGAVASLSLGATRTFRVRLKHDHGTTFDFPLVTGSLLLMHPGCQQALEHTVPKTKQLVGPRINLTFRQVDE